MKEMHFTVTTNNCQFTQMILFLFEMSLLIKSNGPHEFHKSFKIPKGKTRGCDIFQSVTLIDYNLLLVSKCIKEINK